MSDPRRVRTRNRLYLIGVLPALLMLLVSGRIALLLLEESSGLSAFAAEDYDGARGDFAANRVLNPFEPWLASFDEGAARHRAADLEGAIDAYEAALDEDVPAEWVCPVRNNLALAHEELGDAALEQEGRVAAEPEWLTGREVLQGCLALSEHEQPAPGDSESDGAVSAAESAVVIDERLVDKLQGREETVAPEAADPPPADETVAERERRLSERNRRAMERRRGEEQRQEAREDSRPDPGSAPQQEPKPAW